MNKASDYANNVDLKLAGWRVIRIQECEIRTKAKREEALNRLYTSITAARNSEHYQTYDIDKVSLAAEPSTIYGGDETIHNR